MVFILTSISRHFFPRVLFFVFLNVHDAVAYTCKPCLSNSPMLLSCSYPHPPLFSLCPPNPTLTEDESFKACHFHGRLLATGSNSFSLLGSLRFSLQPLGHLSNLHISHSSSFESCQQDTVKPFISGKVTLSLFSGINPTLLQR